MKTFLARHRRRRTFLRRALLLLAGTIVAASLALTVPLRWLAPPTTSFILRLTEDAADYRWRPLSSISPELALAVIAAEDQRFPSHHGMDFTEIRRALADYRRGRPLRGASTISQQLAKNLYLWPERSLLRKALEAWLALWLELCLPKRRILELYLNVAQFGPRQFGAEAASQTFFGLPADRLDDRRGALLAAVLPAPARHRPGRPSATTRERGRHIQTQMKALGGVAYLERIDYPLRPDPDRGFD